VTDRHTNTDRDTDTDTDTDIDTDKTQTNQMDPKSGLRAPATQTWTLEIEIDERLEIDECF